MDTKQSVKQVAIDRVQTSAAVAIPVEPLPEPAIDGIASKPASVSPQGKKPSRRVILLAAGAVAMVVVAVFLWPTVWRAFNTVSTDDAYVNGHFTFVAPRVSGQVVRVLVDDNNRVRKGDLLVQLDREPYQIQVAIKQAAVEAARANLIAARSQVEGLEAMGDAQRWQLQATMERVASQIATLRANVATYQSQFGTGSGESNSRRRTDARRRDEQRRARRPPRDR
jgi:membrane fusion protein (multidrug efflux system)